MLFNCLDTTYKNLQIVLFPSVKQRKRGCIRNDRSLLFLGNSPVSRLHLLRKVWYTLCSTESRRCHLSSLKAGTFGWTLYFLTLLPDPAIYQLADSWQTTGSCNHILAALQPPCSHVFPGKGGYKVAALWLHGGSSPKQTLHRPEPDYKLITVY